MTQFPEELNLASCLKLKKLSVGSNSMASLPTSFFDLTSLTSLMLEKNNFEELPEELGTCAPSIHFCLILVYAHYLFDFRSVN